MEKSVEFEVSSDDFTETLNSLIENESVTVNKFRNRECISLTKENFHNCFIIVKVQKFKYLENEKFF